MESPFELTKGTSRRPPKDECVYKERNVVQHLENKLSKDDEAMVASKVKVSKRAWEVTVRCS